MSVYLIANIDIHDREGYASYEAGFMEVFLKFNGRMLAVDENQTTLEGEWPATRTVLMKFPSQEDAMAWYKSDEYQELIQHRLKASTGSAALVAGLPSFEE